MRRAGMPGDIAEQDIQILVDLDMPAATLVERLTIERERMRWTQRKFADHLGMSATVWRDLRVGRIDFSAHHYAAVISRFPALQGYVFRHIAWRARKGAN
jgi:hypothetical protein